MAERRGPASSWTRSEEAWVWKASPQVPVDMEEWLPMMVSCLSRTPLSIVPIHVWFLYDAELWLYRV